MADGLRNDAIDPEDLMKWFTATPANATDDDCRTESEGMSSCNSETIENPAAWFCRVEKDSEHERDFNLLPVSNE